MMAACRATELAGIPARGGDATAPQATIPEQS